MRNLILLSLLALLSARCDEPAKQPSCVTGLIESIKQEPVRNPPATLWSFMHDGKTFFYVPSYCCDNFGVIYDSQCNVVCQPEGGITGKGDGKCEGIEMKDQKLVWKDERGA